MKICDLTQFYSPYSGGVKRYLREKSAYVERHRPDCEHVIIIPGPVTEMTEEGRTRIYSIASPLIARTSRYRALTRLYLVEEVLEKERPSVIESGDPYQVAWKAIASGHGLEIPVVGFYHSHFPEAYIRSVARYFGPVAVSLAEMFSQNYVCELYNRFARTLVPSPALADLLTQWGVERVEKVELGVDVEVYRPDGGKPCEEMRRELGVPEDRRLLLYVGRLAPEKNVRMLLAAFEELNERHKGLYHLQIVGDGALRGQVKKLAEETGAVSWMSYCENAHALADIYRCADLFVHPGLQETFGLVTIESQACGTPVVGIRGSYMDRIIFPDNKLWADDNTPEALAGAIEKMFDRDLEALGQEASRTVRENYSWRTIFERLFSIYEDVIAEYKP